MTEWDNYIAKVKGGNSAEVIASDLLKGKGRRFFCPGCQSGGGKTPDLVVKPEGFHCYKCGESGDVIKLVMLANNLDFNGALDYLADRAGIARYMRKGKPKTNNRPQKAKEAPKVNPKPSSGLLNANPDQYSQLYDAFLKQVCRELRGTVGEAYLASRGIDAGTAAAYGVRFCADLEKLWELSDRPSLKAAGLSSLYTFQKAELPFLVFPYIRNGQPVFLKARCLLSKAEADSRGVPRFLNTGGAVPCLWNHDAIAAASQVLICEGEIDALSGILSGYVAVGLPGWAHFKDAWIPDFMGKDVILVLDADTAGQKGVRDIACKFMNAGQPVPREVTLDSGKDLNDVFQEFMKDGKTEMRIA